MQEGKYAAKDNVIQRVSTGNGKLDSFLSGGFPRGSLILVSGNPGTGKTIFTASFLYDGAMRENENGIYVSFCESKRSFFENMNSLGLDFERLEKQGRFRFMEMFTTTKEGMGTITGDILGTIKEFGAKRLVIDSYSVMAQALGGAYEGRQVLHTVLGKIVRNLGCTTLVIGEQPSGDTRIGDGAEEFVADGVVNLKLTIPREMEIRKMRGTMLKTRDLTYTIDRGFRVLTTDIVMPESPKMWKPIPDSGDRVSTGASDLDAIIGGGFPKGAYVVLEPSTDVMVNEMRLFTRGVTMNFINQRRGVIIWPTAGVNARELKKFLVRFTTDELFDSYTRIAEQQERTDARQGSLPPYVIPMTRARGTDKETEAIITANSDAFYDAYKELKAKTGNQPVLRSMGYDSLESSYARFPDKLLNELGQSIMRTRAAGNVTLGIAKPSLAMLSKLLSMVDWHIRLTKKNGLLMLQGIKPSTSLYGVDCDNSLGYPVMKLTLLT
ncbi:MAG: AAA family ATPase [Thaumarchaeota archaeon]|nr:AAA family ATPase [Nitrososphaerota archaeon]